MAQTDGAVEVRIGDGIAWIGVAGGGAGRLSQPVRAGLLAALSRVEADRSVACIVLLGAPRDFSVGDAPEALDLPPAAPGPAELCLRVERCGKPVVAGLRGAVLGAGAELALAAHYRIAAPAARFALPDVKLGLPPSAGATQRLPRLIGADAALDLMLSGRAIALDGTEPAGLVDRHAEGPLEEELRAFCAELQAEGLGPRPTAARRDGLGDPLAFQQAVTAHRARLGGLSGDRAAASANPAVPETIAAVEAAQLLPFAGGLDFEAEAAEGCRASEPGIALRAIAAAERAVVADMRPAPQPPLRIAVLGEGPLAVPLLLALLPVAEAVDWGCARPGALHAGVVAIRDRLEAARRSGALSSEAAEARLSRLRVGAPAEMARDAGLILLAGPGQRDIAAPAGVSRLVAYPARVSEVGLRFAPSPTAAKLVEVIAGPQAGAAQLAAAEALALRMGCAAIRVRSEGESLGGRLFDACCRAADALVDLGQSPYAIDAACRDWGWRRGPFLRRDQMGLERFDAQSRAAGAVNWSIELAGAGRKGRQGGAGFYDWNAEGRPGASAEVTALLARRRAEAGMLPAAQLRRLLIGAMANEGARMLAAGMLLRASDLDLVALQVLDMPRWRGGPMHAAPRLGAAAVRAALAAVSHPDRDFWTPHPYWDELAARGARGWPEGRAENSSAA